VRYDGPDLAAVAERAGRPEAEVIARHTAGDYRVAFCGFAPGFAYLTGLDPSLHVPRLARPRTRVPAGSVGIAGEYTAAYPRPSPGGWHLLGRTDADLWDLARAEPALLTPGTRVRFEAIA
jgi:KipI family sensor histidine kinase inhibitor